MNRVGLFEAARSRFLNSQFSMLNSRWIVFGAALLCLAALPASSSARPAVRAGQSSVSAVTSSDIQKLQDQLSTVREQITNVRAQNATRADQLMGTLSDLQDEVTYLKVKLEKGEAVTHQEYGDLDGRIADFQMQVARTGAPDAVPASAPASAPAPAQDTAPAQTPDAPVSLSDVPVGTQLDAKLQSTLSSATAQVEDKVEATTAVDLKENGQVLIPAGSVVRGVVSGVTKATRTDRKGQLTLSFNRITVNGTTYEMRGTVTQASEGVKGEAGKIGTGAGVGAIIGGLLGGFKGALAGILIGGGGMVAATPGKDVELPAGTVLRIRIDSPLRVASGG
jgi:TolA-binding protein